MTYHTILVLRTLTRNLHAVVASHTHAYLSYSNQVKLTCSLNDQNTHANMTEVTRTYTCV